MQALGQETPKVTGAPSQSRACGGPVTSGVLAQFHLTSCGYYTVAELGFKPRVSDLEGRGYKTA